MDAAKPLKAELLYTWRTSGWVGVRDSRRRTWDTFNISLLVVSFIWHGDTDLRGGRVRGIDYHDVLVPEPMAGD